MTKPKKKPKTGDVVGWVIVDKNGYGHTGIYYKTRKNAKIDVNHIHMHMNSLSAPFRIAKIVLAK